MCLQKVNKPGRLNTFAIILLFFSKATLSYLAKHSGVDLVSKYLSEVNCVLMKWK